MAEINGSQPTNNVSFCSSLKDDVWHSLAGPNAFESWHFDAVSDDGREALVIAFYDNYVLSPRFILNSRSDPNVTFSGRHRFPAVSFVYSVDGRPVLSAVNEYIEGDFSQIAEHGCRIGDSYFKVDQAQYGSGFTVNVDIKTLGGRRIVAELECLLIESDLAPIAERTSGVWNAVAPRTDVSGRIMLIGRRGKVRKTVHFRGTGYHDQVTSENIHYRNLSSRMWGRAHFVDSTVVFDRLGGVQNHSAPGKFYLIRDGKIEDRNAACTATEHKRDRWGLLVPRRITFRSDEGVDLIIKPNIAFRSGFSEVKMLSEVTLTTSDGKSRRSTGISEFVDPRRLKSRLFRWISDLRIGREDRSPLF
ncbi:MAG: hypothetical protein QM785_14395 [Pyrinomonadaceae bacterium]